MQNIPINETEAILEPYFDGGESYHDHFKYSVLPQYRVEPEGAVTQTWYSLNVCVQPGQTVCMERDGEADLTGYDLVQVHFSAAKEVRMRVYFNGKEVLDAYGLGSYGIVRGRMDVTALHHIKFTFENTGDIEQNIDVFSLGTASQAAIDRKAARKSPFTGEWPGCFVENPKIGLLTENLLDQAGMERLLERLQKDPYRRDYQLVKKLAYSLVDIAPEPRIGEYLSDRMREKVRFLEEMCALSLVGLVEQDANMLRMACRYMLSLACCKTWLTDPMEGMPGATWTGRSFGVLNACVGLGIAMECAGSFLTWHGRNLIYDAIIMKGLPRMEADFLTLEYIRHMNQGIAFSYGYIFALVTLIPRYPRYQARLDEAERNLFDMLKTTINDDGGVYEGAIYWQYTMLSFVASAYLLARSKGKTLPEYLGDTVNKTGDFGLTLLAGDFHMVPVGDAIRGDYLPLTSNLFAQLTGDGRWRQVFRNYAKETRTKQDLDGCNYNVMFLIASEELPDDADDTTDHFSVFRTSGYTSVSRGNVRFLGISGPTHSHCHGDRGSFILEKNGKPVVIDRGMSNYSIANGRILSTSPMHNLLIPMVDGVCCDQVNGYGQSGGAVLKEATLEDGVFRWQVDCTEVWPADLVASCMRTVVSEQENVFVVTDEMTFTKPTACSFRLNLYNGDDVEVQPVDWQPVSRWYGEYGTDAALDPVYQLRLDTKAEQQLAITTRIILK